MTEEELVEVLDDAPEPEEIARRLLSAASFAYSAGHQLLADRLVGWAAWWLSVR